MSILEEVEGKAPYIVGCSFNHFDRDLTSNLGIRHYRTVNIQGPCLLINSAPLSKSLQCPYLGTTITEACHAKMISNPRVASRQSLSCLLILEILVNTVNENHITLGRFNTLKVINLACVHDTC